MMRHDLATVLGTFGGLVADEVRVGPAQTGRAHRLVGVDHDVVVGCLLDAKHVVVDHRLAVMMLAVRDDVADIAALHRIVTIFIHKIIRLVDPALVVLG